MDTEFHYYMTYLIAVRAGFQPGEAFIIAHAAQNIDDNHVPILVNGGPAGIYKNEISQTMDITRPHLDENIYPVFHFVPGDKDSPTAARVDKRKHDWVTTPNSPRAQQMFEAALSSQDLYRIGVCAHTYVDTWAHQNFLGCRDTFNAIPAIGNPGEDITQDIVDWTADVGHGAAEHKPDIPGLIWIDTRLVDRVVNNFDRFMDAAYHLFTHLAEYRKVIPADHIETTAHDLIADLTADIGPVNDQGGDGYDLRVARYKARALKPEYGGQPLPDYDERQWFNEALIVDEASVPFFERLRTKIADSFGDYSDLIQKGDRIPCTWHDPASFAQTNWYRFQEAVRSHLAFGLNSIQGLPRPDAEDVAA